ncbi:MAG: hypothetical protein FWH40_03370 [Coriobacteriia bacterium]|nr:hypothetical protein [Coriobacteriia bacterium]
MELIKKHPSIIKHACRQAGKGLFGEKIKQARLPHVLEHLIIDLFVQDRAKQYAGNTAWSDRKVGIATIRIGLPESLGEVTDTGYSIYQQLISSAVNELNEFCMAGNVSHFNE